MVRYRTFQLSCALAAHVGPARDRHAVRPQQHGVIRTCRDVRVEEVRAGRRDLALAAGAVAGGHRGPVAPEQHRVQVARRRGDVARPRWQRR